MVYTTLFPLLYLLSILHVMLSTYGFSLVSLLIHALYIYIFLGLASFSLVDTTYIYIVVWLKSTTKTILEDKFTS
jgi:hypothetical protein